MALLVAIRLLDPFSQREFYKPRLLRRGLSCSIPFFNDDGARLFGNFPSGYIHSLGKFLVFKILRQSRRLAVATSKAG